ncbi:hypothetical protein Tco_1001821, partial [Tanacetum coccineum]
MVLSGLRLLVGLDLQALSKSDLVLNKVVEMISCTNESKPLALPWGRTPRLDSDMRSGTLVRQGSAVIVTVDADYLSRMSADPGRVVLLAGVNEQGNQNDDVYDVGVHVVNEEGTADGQESPVDAGIVRIEDEVPATIAKKAKGSRKKRKATGGASSFSLPPKKLKDDHGTSGAGASTGGKSLATLQSLLEGSTLLWKLELWQRQLYLLLLLPSPIPDPPIMTMVVATMVVADTSSVPVPRAGNEPVHHILFVDFASIGEANPDVSSPSYHAGTELSTDSFYVSQEMDSETLHQTYVPKWNVTNDSALDDPDVFRNVIDHLAP